MIGWLKRLMAARSCQHHDRATGRTWVVSYVVDLGRQKVRACSNCGRVWL